VPTEKVRALVHDLTAKTNSNAVLMNSHLNEINWGTGELEFEALMRLLADNGLDISYDFKLKDIWKKQRN